jgi:hypothetical protein
MNRTGILTRQSSVADRPSSTLNGASGLNHHSCRRCRPWSRPSQIFDMRQRTWLKPPLPKCFDCLSVQNTLTSRSRDHNLFHAPSFYMHTQNKYPLVVTVRKVTKESPMTPAEDVVLSERRILRQGRVCYPVPRPAHQAGSQRANKCLWLR